VTTLDPYVEQAIPHEAGHILIGKAVGLPAQGLDHIVIRTPEGQIRSGNFATKCFSPPDDEIPGMDPKLKASYMLFVAGGLAGNIFANQPATEHGIEVDRRDLARVTNMSLEDVAQQAQGILDKHKEVFKRLTSAIRQRYLDLIKHYELPAGRYPLLSGEELEQLLKK
jgi:hypothetical protein